MKQENPNCKKAQRNIQPPISKDYQKFKEFYGRPNYPEAFKPQLSKTTAMERSFRKAMILRFRE